MVSTLAPADAAVRRGAAFGLLARLLGPDASAFDAGELSALRDALAGLGAIDAVEALRPVEAAPDPATLRSRHARLFTVPRVNPYETGYVRVGAGGHTARLADVAGFYRAFGFEVSGERPDHCAAELEFAAVVALVEGRARADGDAEGAEVCEAAWRTFLRDHLGGWLDGFAERLERADPDGPYGPVARAAARLVDLELDRLGVELEPDLGPGPRLDDLPDEAFEPRCGGCGAGPGLPAAT